MLNHGVELLDSEGAQLKRVVKLCEQYFRKVPVLVIAASNDELGELHKLVCKSKEIPSEVR